MLTTGQPLHAFDYDKVAGGQIVVRHPQKGQKLGLLDGKTITPRGEAILICDTDKPIALGGVMGGNNSAIDQNTKRIVVESANFDMYNIRRTSMEHGLFTDAVTRFNKGQSPWQTDAVLAKAVEMTCQVSPSAQVASQVVDVHKTLPKNSTVKVSASFINDRLGLSLKAPQMARLLDNVEFDTRHHGDQLEVTAPFWRTDIAIAEDLVEEVGRLLGYDQLPQQLPKRSLRPVSPNAALSFKKQLRDIMSKAGANELLTYSFVHQSLLTKAGQEPLQAFRLSNALSPDLQYYRLSLAPSLLDKVHSNIKAGNDQFALFELGKVHNKLDKDVNSIDPTDHQLPAENGLLAMVFAASPKAAKHYAGAAFYQARAYLDFLAEQLGLALSYVPLAKAVDYPIMKPYDPARSAIVCVAGTDIQLGCIGEFRPQVLAGFKLPAFTAGFELGQEALRLAVMSNEAGYTPLARYPRTSQDISFKLANTVSYSQLEAATLEGLELAALKHGYEFAVQPLDIYTPTDGSLKHIALRINLWHAERTLTTTEVNELMASLADRIKAELKGERL
jgi:phenylalanyl-tRNA synthetase beta chain